MVQVINRTEKANGYVVYVVKSSDGKSEYAVTSHFGTAKACTCVARGISCYHCSDCEKLEEEAFIAELAKEFVEEAAPVVAAPKKVRRSAKNTDTVARVRAELKLSEEVKVSWSRKGGIKVSAIGTLMPPVCPVVVSKPVIEARKATPQAKKFQNKVAA